MCPVAFDIFVPRLLNTYIPPTLQHLYILLYKSYRPLQQYSHKRLESYTLQHTATHCNTLQHTATLCNTLQHKQHIANSITLHTQKARTLPYNISETRSLFASAWLLLASVPILQNRTAKKTYLKATCKRDLFSMDRNLQKETCKRGLF